MKKILTLLMVFTVAFGFVSCNDNDGDDDTIGGTIQDMPEGDYTVKLVVFNPDTDAEKVLSTSKVSSSGGFTLDLPSSIPAEFLYTIDEDYEGIGLTISNPNAKTTTVYIELYEDGDYADDIIRGILSIDDLKKVDITVGQLIYSDASTKITGTTEIGEDDITATVNINLSKGYTWVYEVATGNMSTGEMTFKITTDKSGTKYMLESDFDLE